MKEPTEATEQDTSAALGGSELNCLVRFPPEIEDELDSFDFDEFDCFFTREEMGRQLLKQRDCDHEWYTFYSQQGETEEGKRCDKCGKQEWH